ncbi:MAG: hypothetical protein ACI9TY_001419 [Alphaproteobacteria bacterium]|jgi:hypothetical protein
MPNFSEFFENINAVNSTPVEPNMDWLPRQISYVVTSIEAELATMTKFESGDKIHVRLNNCAIAPETTVIVTKNLNRKGFNVEIKANFMCDSRGSEEWTTYINLTVT